MGALIFKCPTTQRTFRSNFKVTSEELKDLPPAASMQLRCDICKTEISIFTSPEALRTRFAIARRHNCRKRTHGVMPNESGFQRFFQNKADRFIVLGVAIIILFVFVSSYFW